MSPFSKPYVVCRSLKSGAINSPPDPDPLLIVRKPQSIDCSQTLQAAGNQAAGQRGRLKLPGFSAVNRHFPIGLRLLSSRPHIPAGFFDCTRPVDPN
ncbi:MAG: hypothetical protein DWQ45_09920 [Planctomycetota bacterium]|nr:MAG: hypothetical protein DWQ45_09920 [Planctomycetota bacterium]